MKRNAFFSFLLGAVFVCLSAFSAGAQVIGKVSPKPVLMLPDLIIVYAVVTDAHQGSVKVTVRNRGKADAKNCEIRFMLWTKDGNKLLKIIGQTQPPIKAGYEAIINIGAEIPVWDRKFTVETDYTKVIKESNENNNEFNGQVSN